jgi:single-stranded DNA-binding protein
MGIRSAFLEGNLTREPETVAVGEWSVIRFSIACNEGIKNKDGNGFTDRVHFFDCEYWTKKPQYWLTHMAKGKGVMVQAQPMQNRWSSEDGQTQHSRVVFKLECPPVLRATVANNMDKPADQQNTGNQQDLRDDIPFN